MRQYRVFLDAGVFIASAGSALGGSRQILDWSADRILQPVTSQQVLLEVHRNVAKKLPQALDILQRILHAVNPEHAPEPTAEDILSATQLVPQKDAPILAAARKAHIDYFITLDRKHFIQSKVREIEPFPILLPEEFAPLIRLELAKD